MHEQPDTDMTMTTDLVLRSDLHIYASPFQHQEAWIVGNRRALTELRDALTRVLCTDKPTATQAFANDGEGFKTIIALAEGESFSQLILPYTDESVFSPTVEAKGPFDLVKPEEYRALATWDGR